MIECIINEIINILELDDMLKCVENESKVKMYNLIDIKREDIIKIGKYVRNQNKELYKDSQISKKMYPTLTTMMSKWSNHKTWPRTTMQARHPLGQPINH